MAKYKPADEVLSMSNNISGKVVVITGASSGLGEVTARHLAALGARVVLAARRKDKLDALVAELTNAGGQAIAYQTDVTSQEEVKTLIQGAVDTYGRIDVLINNAGLMAIAPLSDTRTDEWDRMIDINIKGLLYGVAAALPVFQKQNSGHFINIASVAGLKVFSPGGTVYSGTKFAVRAISEGLRHEVGGSVHEIEKARDRRAHYMQHTTTNNNNNYVTTNRNLESEIWYLSVARSRRSGRCVI